MKKMIKMLNFLLKNYKKYFFYKRNGFILLMVMLLISSISLLVVSVFYKVYTARRLSSTFLNLSERERLLKSSISLIIPILGGKNLKKENNKNEEKLDSKDKNEQIEGEKKEKANDSDLLKDSLEIFFSNCYKWKSLDFKENDYGVEGKVNFYLIPENGKIPILSILEIYFSEEKANKIENKGQKNEDENDFKNQKENEEKNSEKSTENGNEKDSDNGVENKKKKVFENKKYKIWQDFFEKNSEKSSIINNYTKYLENEKTDGKNFLKKLIENYLVYDDKIYPMSLWFFLGNKLDKNLFYRNYFKNKDTPFISELISIESNKISPYFLSPYVMQMISGDKFEISEGIRQKLSEQTKEFFEKKKNIFNIESFWNDFYQKILNIPYNKEFFDNLLKNNLIDYSPFIKNFTAIICCESKFGNLTAVVVFEKITSFGKNDKEYLVKQIFFL